MRQLEPSEARAIDPAGGNADHGTDENHGLPRVAGTVGDGERDHGQRHDRAHREIDARRQNNDEHAQRQKRGGSVLLDDVGEVGDAQKHAGLQNGENEHHHQNNGYDAVALDETGDVGVGQHQ